MELELLKVLAVLIVMLGVLYGVLKIVKRRMTPSDGIIEMLHYQPLGPKKGIAIVKIVKDYLVVGVSDEQISLLDKLSPEEIEPSLMSRSEVRKIPARRGAPGFGRTMGLFARKKCRVMTLLLCAALTLPFTPALAYAQQRQAAGGGFLGTGLTTPVEILLFLTLLSLLPAILVMTTSFTRIVVILSFLRQALGTPQVPPTQVIIGLSLFITLFIMSPVIERVYTDAYLPYTQKEINAESALGKAGVPLKEFMLRQTREKDFALFLKLSKSERPATPADLPMKVVIPAFAIGELKKAFEIGFLIFLPFLVIDMVVASVLLSMGMMMLPPVMVSMPFKLLLFVLVDGWDLLVGSIVGGFK